MSLAGSLGIAVSKDVCSSDGMRMGLTIMLTIHSTQRRQSAQRSRSSTCAVLWLPSGTPFNLSQTPCARLRWPVTEPVCLGCFVWPLRCLRTALQPSCRSPHGIYPTRYGFLHVCDSVACRSCRLTLTAHGSRCGLRTSRLLQRAAWLACDCVHHCVSHSSQLTETRRTPSLSFKHQGTNDKAQRRRPQK